ncbi:MAG TPA: VWA containing CoxE family protein, partial [Anaeromyxobacteraceae bacterium]|nr:VWA containing CoxE family protein [Anaeromyxobacteraceae bacterium]
DRLWADPQRSRRPEAVEDVARRDKETRLVIVGDASMAPEELLAANGSIAAEYREEKPAVERLRFLAKAFPHAAWLNPIPSSLWPHGETIGVIRGIFSMFELNLNGLEKAVRHLTAR